MYKRQYVLNVLYRVNVSNNRKQLLFLSHAHKLSHTQKHVTLQPGPYLAIPLPYWKGNAGQLDIPGETLDSP